MVKGIQRQVIVVESPDPKLFEQAIFILKDGQRGISDEELLKEAKRLIGRKYNSRPPSWYLSGPAWAAVGGLISSIVWIFAVLL